MIPAPQPVSDVADFLQHIKRSRVLAVGPASSSPTPRPFIPVSALQSYLTRGVIGKLLACNFQSKTLWRAVKQDYSAVFAILISIGKVPYLPHFVSNASLTDKHLPFLHAHNWQSECQDFFQQFQDAQWQFCAQEFEIDRLNDTRIDDEIILPFTSRTALKEGPDSSTYKVEIYPDYNLLMKGQDCKIHTSTNAFVLKTCNAENAEYHHNEVEAYRALSDQDDILPHMVRFHGSWIQGQTYNMLLEYVHGGTLTDFLEGTDIPARDEDIMKFWNSLLDIVKPLMRIHSLPNTDYGYLQGIHHDIKPDNILVARSTGSSKFDVTFKLADLGLTDFEYVVKRGEEVASRDAHGTQMYNAPEYCIEEDDTFLLRTVQEAKPSKDIWALGCVFSEAAVWSVLGRRGLQQYRAARAAASLGNPRLQRSAYISCFHDGTMVLRAVHDIHLRICKEHRRNDHVVERIVDLVKEMLGNVSVRPNAHQVYRRCRNALETAADLLKSEESWCPPFFLPDDRQVPPERPPEDEGPGRSGLGMMGVSCSPRIHCTTSSLAGGVDQEDQEPSSSPSSVRFADKLEKLSTACSPTPQHFADRKRNSSRRTASDRRPHRLDGISNASSYHAPTCSGVTPEMDKFAQLPRTDSMLNRVKPHGRRSMPAQQLQSCNEPTSPKSTTHTRSRSDTITARSSLPRKTIEDLEQWIERKKRVPSTPPLEGVGYLTVLDGRDQIFLFDVSTSMRTHWPSAIRAFSALAYLVKRMDRDGIEIRFTNAPLRAYRYKDREPLLKRLNCVKLGGQCDIGLTLGKILKDIERPESNKKQDRLLSRLRKKNSEKWGFTVYILTDGIWKDGDSWLASVVEPIKELMANGMHKAQVGIQFIQFGDDAEGSRRLQILKNDLREHHGIKKDIIDTEPCSGNVYKMLLGSIDSEWNRIPSTAIDGARRSGESNPGEASGEIFDVPIAPSKVLDIPIVVGVHSTAAMGHHQKADGLVAQLSSMSCNAPVPPVLSTPFSVTSEISTLRDGASTYGGSTFAGLEAPRDEGNIITSPNDQSPYLEDLVVQAKIESSAYSAGNCDDDIRSLISNEDNDESHDFTTRAACRPKDEIENAITGFLANESSLVILFEQALQLMPRERFVNNLRRVLKSFRDELIASHTTLATRELAAILQPRQARQRIAKKILDKHTAGGPPLDDDDFTRAKERTRLTKNYMDWWIGKTESELVRSDSNEDEQWTSGDAGAGAVVMKRASDDMADKEDDLHEIEEETSTDTGFARLDVVIRSLIEGLPFQHMILGIKDFLLPHGLLDDILPIPRHRIVFESSGNSTYLNTLQIWLEDVTSLEWNWWPLTPTMRPLVEGETRVLWQCLCGNLRWRELRRSQLEILKELLDGQPATFRRQLLCKSPRLSNRPHSDSGQSQPCHAQRGSPPATSTGTPSSPSSNHGSSNDSCNSSTSTRDTSIASSNRPQNVDCTPPSIRLQWLMFGVVGPRITIELGQIKPTSLVSDVLFLRELRKKHRQLRGKLRLHLSFWQLHYWEFVKFQRMAVAPQRMEVGKIDLPKSDDYEYCPRPPDVTPEDPGITRHGFEVMVRTCIEPCWLSAMPATIHDCVCMEENATDLVSKLPKRNSQFVVGAPYPTDRFVWGIQARYVVSAVRVLAIHVVILIISFGIGIWWQRRNTKDLQGAAVPITVAGLLVSMFWTGTGILRFSRP